MNKGSTSRNLLANAPGNSLNPAPSKPLSLWARANRRFQVLLDQQIPAEFFSDPENTRRARLISAFGVLGATFGVIYALFYLLIGHKWGAGIIIACSSGVVVTPYLMRWKKSVEIAGNFFAQQGVNAHGRRQIGWLQARNV